MTRPTLYPVTSDDNVRYMQVRLHDQGYGEGEIRPPQEKLHRPLHRLHPRRSIIQVFLLWSDTEDGLSFSSLTPTEALSAAVGF